MAFKDRLKEARIKSGLTQEQLALKIGVAKSTVTGYEKGSREPDMAKIYQVMRTLHVDANYLWQDDMLDIKNTPPSEDRSVTEEEFELVEIYRGLNEDGQRAYRAAASGVFSVPQYKKYSDSENQADLNKDNDIVG